MKIKYILGAASLLTTMAGCDLDVTMYDGVMAEDLNPRNLVEVSQGSYRLLKNDEGLIDNGFYFWNYGADDVSWGGTSTDGAFKYMTIPEASPTAVRNILGSLDTAPSAIAIWSLKCVRN